ncbi:glycosyltransferase [Paraburkholderia strydomiana]|uniref:glycosyltransferase n=1 Tax=Paraburkholderia strydomiana TaxID=1245417 RepID=UPI002860EF58|nr:glycosyltransferase [Paraburkholderia strydomiana]MDR7009375.1 MGT family glycosyltransferase [Paraburkholderia strydomiana]
MKIGFISMPLTGHLNSMLALARRMQARGNDIVFIGIPDVEHAVRAAGLKFAPFGEAELPLGSSADIVAPVAKLYGPAATRWTIEQAGRAMFQLASQYLPNVIAETGVEALVIDTIHMYLEVVAISLGIPYAHVWSILNIDFSGTTLPSVWPGVNADTAAARARNREVLEESDNAFFGIVQNLAEEYAERVGLKLDWSNRPATVSRQAAAVVSQTPREFDLPNIPWPSEFHYAGPFFDEAGREPIPFDWEKLDGRPLVYASLGTLVNGLDQVYKAILTAVGQMPEIQVVLSKGANIKLAELGPIPTNVIVVDKAPQIEILKRSVMCITHAGLNTTLESLAQGLPMVAIPIAYDQFGVAQRIAYHGVGEFLEIENLTADLLEELIRQVLANPIYREKAQHFKEIISRRNGLDVAAEAIERAFRIAPRKLPAENTCP